MVLSGQPVESPICEDAADNDGEPSTNQWADEGKAGMAQVELVQCQECIGLCCLNPKVSVLMSVSTDSD